MSAPRGKGKAAVTVSAFGQACLDDIDATVSAKECEVLAKAWSRAAQAIRGHEYGEITVIDSDGYEILAIGLDLQKHSVRREERPAAARKV